MTASRLRLVSLIVVAAMAVSAVVLLGLDRRVREERYTEVLELSVERARREMLDFLRPVHDGLDFVRSWAQSGSLVLDDAQAVENQLLPVLQNAPQIIGLDLVAPDGSWFNLSKTAEGWRSTLGSDHGEFEWQSEATSVEKLAWTDLAPTGETGEASPGIVAALGWPHGGSLRAPEVAAMHVGREALGALVDRLAPTDRGLILTPRPDGKVLWASRHDGPHFEETDYNELLRGTTGTQALLSDWAIDWRARGWQIGQAYRMRHAGETWWYLFEAVDDLPRADAAGCLVPESELAAAAPRVVGRYIWGLFGVVGVGVLALIQLAFGYRKKLIGLDRGWHSDDSEAALRAAIDGGESDTLEFKSTLRWNLKANKPGREIEQSWLKTVVAFMNSGGGTLMIGVDDDGSLVGIERDGFRNEDKYLLHFDNLINKQVGLEFARYLTFRLRSIEEQRILVVDCRSANEPVFLKMDEEQDFYVRIGASSRRLPLSKTLEYLEKTGRVKPVRRTRRR